MIKSSTQPKRRPQLRLEEFMPYCLASVAREISAAFAKRYSMEFGISIPEWRVLAHLGEAEPCSSGDICQRTAMDKAMVNRAVTRLVAAGHIKAKISTEDRRVNSLILSRKGRSIYDAIVPIALDIEEIFTSALTPVERNVLMEALRKLHFCVKNIDTGVTTGTRSRINEGNQNAD